MKNVGGDLMKKIIFLILMIIVLSSNAIAGPPMRPVPKQVTSAEITAGTETKLRSYSPADVVSFISTHGGADAFTVKVDGAATAAYLYNAGSGAVRAGTNVTIDDDGDYITINASLAGGAVDTEGTLNADEIAVMHDLDTIKSLTEAEFKTAYNMEAGKDYLAPAGDGGSLTNLDGNNIQDDTIDDDSLDFSDITLDDFVSAEDDYISVATDDTFDFTRNDAGSVTITASDDDAVAGLTILPGGAAAMILGGASTTTINTITDGGSVVIDGLVAIGTDPADAGVIRLENATALAWEDATEATITHVDDTGFIINLALEIDGALNADGAVSLGDGGDNFSVASDGIDIDTSGNVTNAGTIGCGKVTSSAAFESATGLFDVTGAAAITVGSADVTTITLQTDDTGDGTDLVLPAQSVNGSEMLNNTVTATQISATVTLADGDVFDFSGITHTGSTDEGLALPTWANVTPTSDKAWISWDGTNQILKVYDGGWVSISPSGAPTDATYLTLSVDATLSDERVLTESTQGIDFTDGGAGSTLTISLDTTEVDATTWSDGANSSNTWTFDLDTTDFNMVASNGLMTFSDAVTVTDTLTANNGIDLGTSNSITGTTGLTIGGGTETVAINSSDWDIDATGVMSGIGNIGSDGVVTATGFTIGSAAITETELEILDGATLSTTQINYLASATGTTGTTNTNVVFSASPTLTGTAVVTNIDGSGTISGNLFTPDAADGADIGSTSLEFSDIYVADGSVIYFGDDQDVTLTHVADTELTLSADLGMLDDQVIEFGTSDDTTLGYDETTDDRLEISTTLSAATGDEEALALLYTTNKATSGNDTGLLIAMTDTASPGTSYLIDLQVDGSSVWNIDETGKVSIPQGFDDPYIFLNVATSGDTDWYITVDDDAGGDDDDSLKFSTTGQNDSTPELEIQTDGDVIAEGTVTGTSLIMEGGTYDTTIDPGTPTETATYQWPLAKPASTGYALTSTTAGVMSWSEITASPAGASGDVQYNNTTLGAEAAFNYNATNNTLSITQAASNPTLQLGDGSYSWGHTPQLGVEGVLEVDGIASFDGGIDVNEDIDIDLDAADEEMVITNSAEYGAGGSQVTIDNADADVGAQMYLLNLDYSADDGQANADYIIAQDSGGTVFILGQDGDITTTDGDYTTTNGAITAGGAVTGGTVTDGTVTLAGDGTVTGISAGGYPNDSVLFADLDDDGNYGPFTGTWDFTGGTLIADAIDGSGAVDFDIGSADITDVTIITDGDAADFIIGDNSDKDFGIKIDSDTDDFTLLWDEANSELELDAPNYRFGANADEDILLTFDSDSNDGTINWNEDNATFQFSNVLANTPQAKTYNADDDSETVGSDITSSVVLITTDNDSTDETVDIQDGTVSGQMVTFICVSGCDGTDDGVDIDVETDSTCTGCDSSGIYALGTNGDSVTIVWDGTNSAWYEVGYKIQ